MRYIPSCPIRPLTPVKPMHLPTNNIHRLSCYNRMCFRIRISRNPPGLTPPSHPGKSMNYLNFHIHYLLPYKPLPYPTNMSLNPNLSINRYKLSRLRFYFNPFPSINPNKPQYTRPFTPQSKRLLNIYLPKHYPHLYESL